MDILVCYTPQSFCFPLSTAQFEYLGERFRRMKLSALSKRFVGYDCDDLKTLLPYNCAMLFVLFYKYFYFSFFRQDSPNNELKYKKTLATEVCHY
ncbi:TPA: hypothetical protein U0634_000195 [Streptococcus suis]|nr:hypothetical protein [Streptococcus suis]